MSASSSSSQKYYVSSLKDANNNIDLMGNGTNKKLKKKVLYYSLLKKLFKNLNLLFFISLMCFILTTCDNLSFNILKLFQQKEKKKF